MAHRRHHHAQLPRLPMLWFIAWRNIWRNPLRSLLTISALGGGLVMVIFYAALMDGMVRQMMDFATEVSTGDIQIHRKAFVDNQDLYATIPWTYLDALQKAVPGIEVAPRLYAAGLASSGNESSGIMIKAVDPQREVKVTSMLNYVRYGKMDLDLAHTSKNGLKIYNVVVGAQFARNMKLKPGSELVIITQAADGSIGNALFRVAGVMKPVEPNFDRMGVLMSVAAYRSLMYLDSGFHELVVKTPDVALVAEYQRRIRAALPAIEAAHPLDKYSGPMMVRTWRELTPAVADMLDMSRSMVLVIGGIIVGLASLGMLNTVMMSIYERTHEFGILLAIGIGRWWLLLMVLLESFFLALASAVVGAVLGAAVAHYFELHGIDYSGYMPDGFDYGGIIFEPVMRAYLAPGSINEGVVLMMVIAVLASLVPSWRIVRMRPAQVLR